MLARLLDGRGQFRGGVSRAEVNVSVMMEARRSGCDDGTGQARSGGLGNEPEDSDPLLLSVV